mgnify:CR=1 FL=1
MTEEWTPIDFGQTEDTTKNIIKVIGVGGGGCNAVKNMYSEGIVNVSFAVCNTDSQSLSKSPVPVKIMLGKSGLGAGANPEVGRSEAQNTQEDIQRLLNDGTKMAFVTAGMGGGTGTGAAPVVAQAAKEVGALTVAVVTRPFMFEGKKRAKLAEMGINDLRKESDSIVIIPNDKLLSIVDSKFGIKDSFKIVDDVLSRAVSGMSLVVLSSGQSDINVDFADVQTVMSHRGMALMGIGEASGENAAVEAAKAAIESPLLETSIDGARGVLLNVTGAEENLSMFEVTEASNAIEAAADSQANIIWGAAVDNTMGDTVRVTVIATGFDAPEEIGVPAATVQPAAGVQQQPVTGQAVAPAVQQPATPAPAAPDFIDIPVWMRSK